MPGARSPVVPRLTDMRAAVLDAAARPLTLCTVEITDPPRDEAESFVAGTDRPLRLPSVGLILEKLRRR